eukprot:TRINITY_DN19598_c0_g1::TRINITY_DN19598_c0_g1_i1::g.24607::m.24607 TRINITY_DN19598_c0_g1::TRINITY_DN19598_c0_g1_i1::g.24607  ORF type:complete len:343 (-),score=55.64,sp/Q53WK4/NAP1B_ORYSJ/28.40/5e-22,NAP/PF00956.13/3.9e-46 TRINITY_DN19598_c0_g1_i1:66-1061(-)
MSLLRRLSLGFAQSRATSRAFSTPTNNEVSTAVRAAFYEPPGTFEPSFKTPEEEAQFLEEMERELSRHIQRRIGPQYRNLTGRQAIRLKALLEVEKERDRLYREMMNEAKLIHQKHAAGLEKYYDKRRDIVTGATQSNLSTRPSDSDTSEFRAGISRFWCRVFRNHPLFHSRITQLDESVLSHLQDVRSEINVRHPDNQESMGFALHFHFEKNPYFENTVLSKYYYESDGNLTQIEGTEIKHRQGQNLLMRTMKLRPEFAAPDKKEIKIVPRPSFFQWFDPRTASQMDPMEDFELGKAVLDEVIPRAIDWYSASGDANLFQTIRQTFGSRN